jgi:hypothetical protein
MNTPLIKRGAPAVVGTAARPHGVVEGTILGAALTFTLTA